MLFGFLIKKLRLLNDMSRSHAAKVDQASCPGAPPIGKGLDQNLKSLKDMLGGSGDMKEHAFLLGPEGSGKVAVVFIDGMVNSVIQTEAIFQPLIEMRNAGGEERKGKQLLDALRDKVLCVGDVERVESLGEVMAGILSGDTALMVDGCAEALMLSTKGYEKRAVTEPQTESVIRGPREGFTENLRTNTALIRRRIQNPALRLESMTAGRKTRTKIGIMYVDGVANPGVVDAVRYRIGHLDVDSVLESGYIEQYIEDAPFSPFATIGYTEKPDVAVARMLEGRVAILVDGTPFVLTAPMLFVENFQSAEDYYVRPLYASLTRLMRYVAYFITVFGPAVYIALTTFHQEMLPTALLMSMAAAREGTPFPAFVEALIMVIAYEILREAGLRLPRPVGQAVSIVGALVMGDAAVSAGLVGAPMVITIAITAVASFVVPAHNDSSSILRLAMMCLAAFMGGYGIVMGLLALMVHLATLSSFGVPFFEGFVWSRDQQDIFVRAPLWLMTKRPKDIAQGDVTRRRFFIPPLRPHDADKDDSSAEEDGQ